MSRHLLRRHHRRQLNFARPPSKVSTTDTKRQRAMSMRKGRRTSKRKISSAILQCRPKRLRLTAAPSAMATMPSSRAPHRRLRTADLLPKGGGFFPGRVQCSSSRNAPAGDPAGVPCGRNCRDALFGAGSRFDGPDQGPGMHRSRAPTIEKDRHPDVQSSTMVANAGTTTLACQRLGRVQGSRRLPALKSDRI